MRTKCNALSKYCTSMFFSTNKTQQGNRTLNYSEKRKESLPNEQTEEGDTHWRFPFHFLSAKIFSGFFIFHFHKKTFSLTPNNTTEMSTSQPLSAVAPCFHPRKRVSKPPATSVPNVTATQSNSDGGTAGFARHAVRVVQQAAGGGGLSSVAPPPPPPPPPFRSSHFCAPQPKWFSQRGKQSTRVAATGVADCEGGHTSILHNRRGSKHTTTSVINKVNTSSSFAPHQGGGGGSPYAFTSAGLSEELRDFVEYVALNTDEQKSRRELIHEVEEAAASLWGATTSQARVVVYGSYALDVSLPTSDVDMAIVFRPLPELCDTSVSCEQQTTKSTAPTTTMMSTHDLLCRLHLLSKKLNESARLRCSVIEQCRVPVVHIEDTWSGMSGDVSMSVPDLDSVVSMQKSWLRNRSPLAKELIVITKAALKQWGLNSSFTGGLSSTCVYLLVQRFLAEQDALQSHKNSCCVGEDHRHGQQLAQVLRSTKDEDEGRSTLTSPSLSVAGLSTPGGDAEDSSSSTTTTALTTPRAAAGMLSPSLLIVDDGMSRAASLLCGAEEDDVRRMAPLSSMPSPTSAMTTKTSSSSSTMALCDGRLDVQGASEAMMDGPAVLAKTLLAFWKYCGHDVFATGYEISNTFLPTVEQLLTAELCDLSKGAFRLAEVQMLFKHSVGVLEQLVTHTPFGGMFTARPPTPLSAILTDPRAPHSTHSNGGGVHRRKRNDHY
ncbi:nucleotidyl transferase, putative [Bodo saltans]|uniref:Nucleotidyl transferase, putative n=1 Tax=Bodo saltans TaxID=75058 RepID=A0A0S4J3H3_BODSA|nr:nucleotidyl transferase, putative [Bodo saltans]|eukprot:CUG71154.1 nucleotidyl transferase, putative [Bodo saltans]